MFKVNYNSKNIFKFYEGTDPDLYTDITGENLNKASIQLGESIEQIVDEINQILLGNEKFEKLKTIDLDVLNSFKINDVIIKGNKNILSFIDNEGSDNIVIDTYKIKAKIIEINSLKISSNLINGVTEIWINNDNTKTNIKSDYFTINTVKLENEKDEDNNINFLKIYSTNNEDTALKIGSAYFTNSYINFGSNDLKDAIVFNDKDNGDAKNSFLFYADGKIENSTLIAGDVKTIGADVAEYYLADKNYEKGTVLQVSEKSGIECEIYNGGKVFGVVSENPGIIVGDKKGNCLVALKGKVKVKINGTAKKGDYIIADKNGKGIAKKDINTIKDYKKIIGIVIEDFGENEVLIKI